MSSKYFGKSDQKCVDISDDDIEVIGSGAGQTTPNKTKIEDVIEIQESPEIVRKRNNSVNCDYSPIVAKKRNRLAIIDSDDEERAAKQIRFEAKQKEDLARMAFEEMCERNIKELQDLFPEIDVCEIQDALIQCDWSVFNASIKLGNLYEGTANDDNQTTASEATNGATNEPKIVTNNEKMKSMDYYRKWTPYKSSVDSDEEKGKAGSSKHNFESIKNVKNKMSKMDRRDLDLDVSDDSDGEDYKKESRIVCGSSSDESDDDNTHKKYKDKTKTIVFKTDEIKSKVVAFLQNSNPFELQIIPGVSQKKIDIILNLRPFANWSDVVIKFNSANLSSDILDNCAEVLKSREIVDRLMSSCEEISDDISKTVERLKALDQPKILNPEMKLSHYQMVGLNWLAMMHKKGINCILADEMGLGKTIQVISLFAYLRESRNITGPHLVIVPASTLDNWSREFHTWCPTIKLLLYYGSQMERAEMRDQINRREVEFDVILTTYQIAGTPGDKSLFKKNKFKYIVFDEAHMLKNMKSSRFTALMNLNAKFRLLLTGTPLQNNLLELMSLLIFTLPSLFRGRTDHIKTLFTYSNKESVHRVTYINDRIEQAKKIMRPFVLRRLKSEVLQELPVKIDQILKVPMTERQEQKYMELIEEYQREIQYKKITFEDSEPEEKIKRGTGMLMELRKVANHPLLIRSYYNDSLLKKMAATLVKKEEYYKTADEKLIVEDMQVMHDFELYNLCKKFPSINHFKFDTDMIFDSGKFEELDHLLTKYRFEGKRVLIFSQFTIMLDIIEEYMNLRLYKYLRLDGGTKVGDRLDLIDKFNDESDIFVFLLSTRAGGLGINLTSASVVIIHDIDFNPYNDKQAEDRCHRIGQTQEVIVYRLISQDSVEEGMLKIAEEKLKLGKEISNTKSQGLQRLSQIQTLYDMKSGWFLRGAISFVWRLKAFFKQ